MSAEDVALVRRLYEAVALRDNATVLSLYDPELIWDHTHNEEIDRLMGGPTVYRGHAGLRQWSRSFYDAWSVVEADLEEVIDAGESVVAVLDYKATGRVSGAEVQITRMAGVFTIAGGKVVRVVWFRDRDEALAFAGLGPAGE